MRAQDITTPHEEREARTQGETLFASYTNADVQWAEWIAWTLEQAGYTTTIQAWDFRPASNFVLEMQRALHECERVIAVLSPRYLASRFAAEEWSAAIASDPTGDKLLPIRIEPCENEGLLRARIYIDLVGTDEPTARQRLLAGVKREPAKPTTPPRSPPPRRADSRTRHPPSGTFRFSAIRISSDAMTNCANCTTRSPQDKPPRSRSRKRFTDSAEWARRTSPSSTPIALPPTMTSSGGCARMRR